MACTAQCHAEEPLAFLQPIERVYLQTRVEYEQARQRMHDAASKGGSRKEVDALRATVSVLDSLQRITFDNAFTSMVQEYNGAGDPRMVFIAQAMQHNKKLRPDGSAAWGPERVVTILNCIHWNVMMDGAGLVHVLPTGPMCHSMM